MKTRRWLPGSLTVGFVFAALHAAAQTAEPLLPRPGAVLVTEATGEVSMRAGDQTKTVKSDDRLRIGSTVATGRKSMTTLALSNGATLQIGPESELEIEEFGQATFPESTKVADLKEEPTLSRTRLRLARGDVTIDVKPLKVSRGSLFLLALPAGTLRTGEGTFRAMVRMSDLGLGVCTLELQKGRAEFLLEGAAAFAAVPIGAKLAFALEIDRATGAIKVGEMPKETPRATTKAGEVSKETTNAK